MESFTFGGEIVWRPSDFDHPAVSEAAAIAVPDPLRGEAVICFCVLTPGKRGDEALAQALKEKVGSSLGKPLKPEAIKFVGDLPKRAMPKSCAG